MSSISISTSSKVIVLRKGKRKKPSSTLSSTADRLQDEEENDLELSQSSSSEDDTVTPIAKDASLKTGPSSILRSSTTTFDSKPSTVPPSAAQSFDALNINRQRPQEPFPQRPQHSLDSSGKFSSTQQQARAENDDDEDDDEEEELVFSDTEESIRQKIEQTREQMKFVLQNFTPEQMHRYETFRRVGFSRTIVKKIMQNVLGHAVNPNTVIVMGGIAKVFVGELVEEAKDVMDEWGENGPLLPSHLIEANRRLKDRYHLIPHCTTYRQRKIL